MSIQTNKNSFLNRKFSRNDLNFNLSSFFVVILVFLISLILSHYYVGGDQFAYHRVYKQMPNLSFFEAQTYYQKYLTSHELIHFILVYIFSMITEKSVFISIFNSILAYSVLLLFRQWGANSLISASIVLTNYYLYVLYIPAERLKFAVIFLVFSLIYIHNKKNFIIFSILSILSHFSILIVYASILLKYFLSKIKLLIVNYKLSYSLIFVMVLLIIGGVFFLEFIVHKVNNYIIIANPTTTFNTIIKPSVFLVASLIYAKNKTQIIYFFIPLIFAAYIIGDSRVNIFCFFVFLYAALPVKNGLNLGILTTLIYFAYKNYFFLVLIFKHGNGFFHL
jgi:hypothetical protein